MRNIDFGEILFIQLPEEQLPEEHPKLTLETPLVIYVVDNVLDQIKWQAEDDKLIESGGILLGYPFININRPSQKFVVITDCIKTNSDNRSRSHFTVSPEELVRVRDEVEEKYPGLIAVGWYHSHPGLGVFLSSQDLQITKSIYNADWHIAYVIDHIKKQHGFFYGKNGIKTDVIRNLHQRPVCIDAISRYNIALASKESKELEKFKRWLVCDKSRELAHWREKGEYQDVILNSTESHTFKHAVDRYRESETKDDAFQVSNRRKIEKHIELAETYAKEKRLYLAASEIEEIIKLGFDRDVAKRISKILHDLSIGLK